MIKGVIFDLDGVICHTDIYHFKAWNKISKKLKLYFDEEINHNLRGISRRDSLEVILKVNKKEMDEREIQKTLKEKNEYYLELLNEMTEKDLDENVLYTLKKLKEKVIKIAIGSSSKNAKIILEKLGIITLFDAIIDGNQIENSKPNPEIYKKAIEMIKQEANSCIIVEDARVGIEAGNVLGTITVGYNLRGKAENLLQIPKYDIEKIEELLKFL